MPQPKKRLLSQDEQVRIQRIEDARELRKNNLALDIGKNTRKELSRREKSALFTNNGTFKGKVDVSEPLQRQLRKPLAVKVLPAIANFEKKQVVERLVEKKMNTSLRISKMLWYIYEYYISMKDVQIHEPKVRKAVQDLGIKQSHLRRLKALFDYIDTDDADGVLVAEVLDLIHGNISPFTDQIFYRLLTVKRLGKLDLEEFVYLFIVFCTFSKDELLKFCFDAFDTDQNGFLSESEYLDMMRHIITFAPDFPDNYAHALEQFDTNRNGLLDFDVFVRMEFKYPMLVYPAFHLQDDMWKCSLGTQTWLTVLKAYNKKSYLLDYMAKHNGQGPPKSILERIQVYLCCFCKFCGCGTTKTSSEKVVSVVADNL